MNNIFSFCFRKQMLYSIQYFKNENFILLLCRNHKYNVRINFHKEKLNKKISQIGRKNIYSNGNWNNNST